MNESNKNLEDVEFILKAILKHLNQTTRESRRFTSRSFITFRVR